MKSKPMKLLWAIPVFLLPILIFLAIGFGNAGDILKEYNNLRPNKSNGISRQLTFLTDYTMASGDLHLSEVVGIDEETMQQLMTDPTQLQDLTSADNSNVNVPVDSTDLRPIAIAVASTFKKTGSATYGVPNPGADGYFYNYSQSSGSYTSHAYNSLSCSSTHRDCSCFVSSMLYLGGFRSARTHFTSSTISGAGTDITSQINVLGDLQSGDILWKSGHVAMVVYNDGTNVYVGDFGSATSSDHSSGTVGENGDNTGNQGYAYMFSANQAWVAGNQPKVGSTRITKFTKVYRP